MVIGSSKIFFLGFQLFHFYFQIVSIIYFMCTLLSDSLHLKVKIAKMKARRQSPSGFITQHESVILRPVPMADSQPALMPSSSAPLAGQFDCMTVFYLRLFYLSETVALDL